MGIGPTAIAVDLRSNKVYVANYLDNTVSVINSRNDKKEDKDIPVGDRPTAIVVSFNKVYVANSGSDTVSVIDPSTNTNIKNITVGHGPTAIDHNFETLLIYITNYKTISVIKSSDDMVAAGITFNVSPGNSGNIPCNTYNSPNVYNNTYPTNTYLYVDVCRCKRHIRNL